MPRFAKVVNNKVMDIIVAEQAHINTLTDKDFYILDDGNKKNPAQANGFYDAIKDSFIPVHESASWTLNETTGKWEPPTAKPDDGKLYTWNEENTNWDEVE